MSQSIFALVTAILPTTNYPFAAQAALDTQDTQLAQEVLDKHQADLDKPEREGIRRTYCPSQSSKPDSKAMAHITRLCWRYDELRKEGFLAF